MPFGFFGISGKITYWDQEFRYIESRLPLEKLKTIHLLVLLQANDSCILRCYAKQFLTLQNHRNVLLVQCVVILGNLYQLD